MAQRIGTTVVGIISRPDTQRKLEILSEDARYDLACACGTSRDEGRRRGSDGRWIYPVALPNGGKSVLFKTLVSNVCANDCRYCPLRKEEDVRRCTLGPEEIETAAGLFRCEKFGIMDERTMQVYLGGIEALRYEREETHIWLSPEVPFWGLVRSRIERESSTRLPDRPRFQPKPKSTVTESILVSYRSAESR